MNLGGRGSGGRALPHAIELLLDSTDTGSGATVCSLSADRLPRAPMGVDGMIRHVVRGVYIVVAVVACPLLAWNLAVGAANRGFGWRGFFAVLVAVPIVGAVLAAGLLGRRGREATSGVIAAVTATLLLVIVLFFVTFRLVTP